MRQYPSLAEPYASALREAVSYVFQRFVPCAVVAAGTIVRGSPYPSSDLDIYVLRHAPERQRVQRLFRGVPAEIFVNPPEQVERYLVEEARDGRPVTAHMLSTGFVVYTGDECLARLRQLSEASIARGPDVSERELLIRRYIAATNFEDAVDVISSDPEASVALLNRSVDEAVRYAFWSARVWEPRAKDVFRRLEEVDAASALLARSYYRASSPDSRLEIARALFGSLGIPTGFFEWESAPEALA